MKQIQKMRSNMSTNLIGGLVSMVLVFGLVVCVIGNWSLVSAFRNEYSVVTSHMADAAVTLVNGDNIDRYLAGEEEEELDLMLRRLNILCKKLNVSLIYIIKVDQSDYGRFVSVANLVNNSVDDTHYSPWELGHKRDTTNDEYRQKYKAIYEEGSAYETVFRFRPSDGSHPHITTLVPVKDSVGNVTAILCVQRPIREMANAFRPYFYLIILGALIMVLAVSFLAAGFLRKSIIRPVEQVSAEAARFAKEGDLGEPLGDISDYEVIRDLAHSIDSMETDMVNYIENLTAATAERERIGAELNIAAMIQNDALPAEWPAFPDRQDFDIYGSMDPAKEVGGDFFNFLLIDEDHLGLVIADVSGKGFPAAMLMMVTSLLIREKLRSGNSPAEVLCFMNDDICQHNHADMFETVWLGILEISTGRLTASNAGHEYPLLCRKDGLFELIKDKHGFVIGAYPGMKYTDYELKLEKGDKLFVYTDGLPEATDSSENMYTIERTIRALNEVRTESPQGIVEGMRKKVSEFVGVAPTFDDLTMLCVELKAESKTE